MDKTIFYGNGLNRCNNNNISWESILISAKNIGYTTHTNVSYSNTFKYERIYLLGAEIEIDIKRRIAKKLGEMKSDGVYYTLKDLDVSNFITTNYDYSFHQTVSNEYKNSVKSLENLYSIRRHYELKLRDNSIKIWNIHGELDDPKTIMLGLDQYTGAISKIESYVKGKYKYTLDNKKISVESIIDKLKSDKYDYRLSESWIDLFFFTDVHIIGFGLDYSEKDLWWLLNKRARYIKKDKHNIRNTIYFYGEVSNEMADLLKSFEVNVVEPKSKIINYSKYYTEIIENLK